MTVGENQLITFELNSDAGGTFVIEADYEPYATVNAGSSVSLANLEDGEIDINIVYYGSNNYIYYFPCSKSGTVFVLFPNGNKLLVVSALKENKVTIDELIKSGLEVIKEKK